MSADDFWMIYEEAQKRADTRLVQFVVAPEGVTAWAWEIADWSPVRSKARTPRTRAYYHILAMSHARVC